MEPKLERLDTSCYANKITEYIVGLTSGSTPVKKATKSRERHFSYGGWEGSLHFTQNIGVLQNLTVTLIAEIQESLLRHIRLAQFEVVETAKFHTLDSHQINFIR